MALTNAAPMTKEEEWKYAERSLAWYGWGSPVGLGLALVSVGLASVLIRLAIVGF